jgi:glycoprotein 3-alpha-L-fucosyltransferase
MLFEKDFDSIADLAKKVKEIANNDTLFKHYTRYKDTRPSDKFLALYDISAAHSRCRMCIKMADLIDEEFGEYGYGHSSLRSIPTGITVRVRERNKYFFQDVHLEKLTYKGLVNAIMNAFKAADHQPVWRNNRPKVLDTSTYKIYRIYRFHARQTMWDTLYNEDLLISSDAAVKKLKSNERLEVILV